MLTKKGRKGSRIREKQDRVVLTDLSKHAVNERREAMAGRGERI